VSNARSFLFRTRQSIRDMGLRVWNDPELLQAANEGKNELVKIIRQAREDYFVTTTTGTITTASSPNPSVITLPADFAELKQIEVTTSGREDIRFTHLDRANPQFQDALVNGQGFAGGVGQFYYDIMGLDRMELAPGADEALGYLIYYVKTIPDMTAPTDTPTGIPPEHWDAIVTWMVCEALRSMGDNRLVAYEDKLSRQLENVVASVNARQIREAEFVRGFMEDEWW
jgi:hypothetical protein